MTQKIRNFIKRSVKSFFITGILIFVTQYIDAQMADPDIVINRAEQGDIVSLPGFFSKKIKELDYQKQIAKGPQFVISDDPEYITDTQAIALKEKVVPGSVRLYLYNVNGVEKPKQMPRKILAMLRNTGDKPLHFDMLQSSGQPPGTNYYLIGKTGLADFLSSRPSGNIIIVPPGKSIVIDPKMEEQTASYNELVHGIYEFSIDQPAEIEVLQTSPATSSTEAMEKIHNIAASAHANAGRGLFPVSNYKVSSTHIISTTDGPINLTLADGKIDPWVKGTESITHRKIELAGNYGIMYDIELKWKSPDGKALALVSWNPQCANSKWCQGMANAMIVSSGKFAGGVIQLPSNQLTVGGAPQAVLVQVFKPSASEKIQTIHLTYSPPGASCLPTPLVFIPVNIK